MGLLPSDSQHLINILLLLGEAISFTTDDSFRNSSYCCSLSRCGLYQTVAVTLLSYAIIPCTPYAKLSCLVATVCIYQLSPFYFAFSLL